MRQGLFAGTVVLVSTVAACISLFGVALAFADPGAPPLYGGAMTFEAIQGPSGPEDFSWEVRLEEGQELKQVDEQQAQVYYEDGHTAGTIDAVPAHDAVGANVPTSIEVTEGDIVTLTVHHRAGNPAAGGAPFVYPIVAGPGWDGGFQTEIVSVPKGEQEPGEEGKRTGCLVPRLKGKSLRASKKLLRDGECRIGDVRRPESVAGRVVVGQHPRPGRTLAPWAAVGVTLGG